MDIDNTTSPPVKDPQPQAWGWLQAIFVQLGIILLAQSAVWLGLRVGLPPPPWNWLAVIGGTAIAVALGAAYARRPWLRWLSGAPFAVTIITIIALIGLCGTVIVQDTTVTDALTKLGFRAIFTSFPFAVAILLMQCNLGTLIGRRVMTRRAGSAGFLLNHLGLSLVIIGMLAGAAQLQKLTLRLTEGESTTMAADEHGNQTNLGATIQLKHFTLEKFPPKLAAAVMEGRGSENPITDTEWPAEGRHFHALGLDIQILKYYPLAMPAKGGWQPSDHHGLPAARVRVTTAEGKTTEDWITPGIESLGIPSNPTIIDGRIAVGFLEQQPKSYRSDLVVTPAGEVANPAVLEVNQPVRVGEWMLYQNSYTITMAGRASIIEAIRDPALPLVYTGLACMLLGAFLAFWTFPKRKEAAPTEIPPQEEHTV